MMKKEKNKLEYLRTVSNFKRYKHTSNWNNIRRKEKRTEKNT